MAASTKFSRSPLSRSPSDVTSTSVVGRELKTLDDQGKAPSTRIRDAQALHRLFLTLMRADQKSAYNRTLLQEMVDGAPPVADSKLQRSGSSFVYNLNWLGADAKMSAALASYDDLLESNGDLIVPHFKPGVIDPQDVQDVADVIAEEWSATVREYSDFYSNWNRLATEFVGHGVAFTYFPDADTPFWETGGWDQVMIPRRTRAKDEAISVFISRHEYRVSELYSYISNPAYAKNWDENEVKRAIVGASRYNRNMRRWFSFWPAVEEELKNNDLGFGFGDAELVYALHCYVKEFDGSYSFYVILENGTAENYLYHDEKRYDAAKNAFTSFTLGVGNGTFHSIRGQLWKIYPFIQTSNRFNNKMLTNADIALTILLQGEEGDTYDDLQITLGPAVGYLPPTAKVVERVLPDVSKNALPMIQFLDNKMQSSNAQFQAPEPEVAQPTKGNPPTKYQIQKQQQAEGSLTANSINRFYRSVDIVFGEQFRRAQAIGPSGGRLSGGKARFPEIKDFFARCKERNVPSEMITKGIRKVTAFRAIGNGSPQLRMLGFDEIEQMAGQLDETGRVLVTRDRIAARFNRQMADRYRPKVNRIAPDTSIAVIENAALKSDQIPVLPDQNHAVHAAVHVPKFQDIVGQIVAYREQNPEADFSPMEPMLTWALNLHDHALQHVEGMAANPLRLQDMKSYRAALEQGGNLLAGFARELQSQERHAAMSSPASNSAPGGGQAAQDQISASNPKLAMEMQREQVKLQMDVQTHGKAMELASAKVAQIAQAMRISQIKADAEIAQGIRARQTSVPQNAAV
jgi:hypothetical protein